MKLRDKIFKSLENTAKENKINTCNETLNCATDNLLAFYKSVIKTNTVYLSIDQSTKNYNYYTIRFSHNGEITKLWLFELMELFPVHIDRKLNYNRYKYTWRGTDSVLTLMNFITKVTKSDFYYTIEVL